MRKDETNNREAVVSDFTKKLNQYQEKSEQLEKKKPWITAEQRKDLDERIDETKTWLNEVLDK